MRFDDLISAVGHTPLVRLVLPAAPGVEVYAKLELQNLFAMKDRVARQVVLDARRAGLLADGAPIIESSSGTMALGLALVGTYLGHAVHIVTDPRIDPITSTKLQALGCAVHVVERMTSGGWQGARLARLAQLRAELPGAFWPRQYNNPQNPAAYAALAAELHADLDRIDVLVGAVGSGGSLCGTSRALRAEQPAMRTVAVDCVGSVLFGQPDRPERRQSGLGNSLLPENLDHSLVDEVHWLADTEAFQATRELAREQKIFGGNTSGSVYQVLRHLAMQACPGTRLVGIFPDRGDRYVEGVYDALPVVLPACPELVRWGTVVNRWSRAEIDRAGRRRLVFVEANTSGSGIAALHTACRLGMEPVLVTERPGRYRGLSDTPARVVEVDTNDPVALSTALDAEADGGLLDGVTTTSEFYVVSAAESARRLGLPTTSPAALARCRDKGLMREVLAAAGLPQPSYAVLDDPREVPGAVRGIGLPCVVKPPDDSGSSDVLLCSTVNEAVEHATTILAATTNVRGQPTAGKVLIESYIDGAEFSVEMLVHDGIPTCLGITRKHLTRPPHFVERMHVFPADLPDPAASAVIEVAAAALAKCGVRLGVMHVEVKLDGAAAVVVVEINARPAGGMIPELIRLATGLDLVEQHLRCATRLPVAGGATIRAYSGIRFLLAEDTGLVEAVTGVADAERVHGVAQVVITATPGAQARPPRDAYDRLGYVIAVGASADEVESTLAEAVNRITVAVAPTGARADVGARR